MAWPRNDMESGCSGPVPLADMTAMESKYEYEYLVKYKNLSYLHTQWLTAGEIGKTVSPFYCPGSVS